jgi:hypothetical protein
VLHYACGDIHINFVEMIGLLRELSAFQAKGSKETPKVHIYDNRNAGYTLWTKVNTDDNRYNCFVTDLAEKHGLRVKKFENYLIMFST